MSWGRGSGERLLNALEEFPIFRKCLNTGDKLEVCFSGKKKEWISWLRLTEHSSP